MIAIGVGCLLAAIIMWGWGFGMHKQDALELRPRAQYEVRSAVLIPARDESVVIQGLLDDLKKQTVSIPRQDIYVIVESKDDPTVEICRQRDINVVLRRDLTQQRKGYALNDAVQEILAVGKHYDLYFVFDADNLLAEDFVEKMLLNYARGYQVATGQRMAKNGNVNVIAAASGLTFAMINGIGNRLRSKHAMNVIFSGTGLYVAGELVEGWGGWPFHSLTEDYELSMYATWQGLATVYDPMAVFFDEQPVKYWQTVAQRERWIRGYFDVRREYVSKLRALRRKECKNYGSVVKARIGVKPVILLIVGLVCIGCGVAIRLAMVDSGWGVALVIGVVLGLVYIVLLGLTVLTLKSEDLGLNWSMKVKMLLFNPWYLLTYVPCAVKALVKKNVPWTRIVHGAQGERQK